ncbi:riboflavin biosynthesis protein RibF [Arabiibacter massiliensis]|uniref:riboflavin biosynthesis protein RibF n=1 Tax=Arabiibacter massiliensis TaxID=1870985 RepID=UPI0009BB2402|nr:riboflavin biosynthesis protein RibF [Arabiibacter massiliensis]
MAEIYRIDGSFDHGFFEGTSCAFGVFDGVHQGHRFLLGCARETAERSGGASVALTFDIDPDEVFHPERLKKLMTNEERLAMLASTGVDAVCVLPFTREFAASTPAEFLVQTFDGTVPAYLHVGFDFKFGARARGTVEDLDVWGAAGGTKVQAHGLKSEDGAPITATRIRLLLADGDVEEAARLLGRPYFMTGTVRPGRGEGADFGFRTANLVVPDQLRPLGDGVYAAWAEVDGARYKAAVNVGVPATFADRSTATCEVHLLDFEGDLYGKPVKVEFFHWLREMRKFDDVDELIATVQGNIQWVRDNL